MPKSKARITDCEDCALCEQVSDFHKNNDVCALLNNVKLWDYVKNKFNKGIGHYKKIRDFKCLLCTFKTNKFNDWKEHILSLSHMAESHRIKNVYSYICENYCKVVLYGTKESIHITCKHIKSVDSKRLPTLMAEVMIRYLNKLPPIYCCFHCKEFDDYPINHTQCFYKKKRFIDYYCKFCRVTIFANTQIIAWHSLSVEHMTLKCLNELCSTAKKSCKKIKLSEQSNKYEENNCLPVVKNEYTTSSIKVPENNTDQSNEDRAYGEYVIQRLKNIKNETVCSTSKKSSKRIKLEQSIKYEENNCLSAVNNEYTTSSIKVENNTDQSNEDQAYGEYVIQRLKNIKNETVCSTSKKSSKRIKLEQSIKYEENNCLSAVNNEYTTSSIKVENNTDQSNEDQAYGEYVIQRLKNIKNETVKQNIKLEIDYLFYANAT